jgi:hypothetical protein
MDVSSSLAALSNNIPRRHTVENVKEIYSTVDEYEGILMQIEAVNLFYEKNIAAFFNDLDSARAAIKKSADNKASKKNKDIFFDEASVILKDSITAVIEFYGDGTRTA